MSMTNKYTTVRQLQKVINDNLVIVRAAKVQSKDCDLEPKLFTPDQFKDDLDFYMESGIFADTLDCRYNLQGKNLTADIGNLSPYCDSCITVDLIANDGVNSEDLEKVLRKAEEWNNDR